ncbi:TetR/AcrR family transcriptional regulator [Paenibacillus thermoaerophilus]|uniref:TetR/AcrR family transcriptional regulator n=1 Tax=Paenibacillus thermoaerophilus TaxID=1215385 RepID=A0ABW2V5Y6_9BACL|nr:TetR/AcrR family transcriptional regulator [Paenibacillus thermoaerophilus]TMV16130.1 TetR/AcrR family transcriptional regulator [Paenibacillus thermoaerophilus]
MNREQKKLETRSRLIEAALHLFAEQGFEATTVAQITERAGVAKGTFFNYFDNKEDVLCEQTQDWAHEEILKVIGKPGPLIPRLRGLLQLIAQRIYFTKPISKALIQGWLGTGKAARIFEEGNREMLSAIAAVMREGQERGDISAKLPPELLAELALQTFYGVLLLWASSDEPDETLAERLSVSFDFFFQGLSPETKG